MADTAGAAPTPSFSLDIAGVTFEIALPVPGWLPELAARYAAFATAAAPRWRVALTLDPALDDADDPWIEHDGQVTRFRVAAHAGWLDLGACRAAVSTPSQARAASGLERVLAYACMQTLPRELDGLLLHGAGVVSNGGGCVFFGPSGAGKTTIAQLAAGRREVLTDENVVVRSGPGGPRLFSTPFWGHSTPGGLVRRTNRNVPLRALCALEHAPDFRLERLGPAQAVLALLATEKIATERADSAAAWLAAVERLISQVPIYRLHFRPTPELWDFLTGI